MKMQTNQLEMSSDIASLVHYLIESFIECHSRATLKYLMHHKEYLIIKCDLQKENKTTKSHNQLLACIHICIVENT